MYVIKQFSKFLASDAVKIVKDRYATVLAENTSRNYGFSTSLVSRNFSSYKGNCKKKKVKGCIQKHPGLNKLIVKSSCPDEAKSGRDCAPTGKCPCVPPPHRPPSKMEDIHDCPNTDLYTKTDIKCLREDGKRTD